MMSNFKCVLLFFVSVLVFAVDCRHLSNRHNFLNNLINSRRNLTTTTTIITTIPTTATTTTQQTTTTANPLNPRLKKKRPYNIYEDRNIEFILPMLGNTKPPRTSTISPTTKRVILR